jgi:hypothetical protein
MAMSPLDGQLEVSRCSNREQFGPGLRRGLRAGNPACRMTKRWIGGTTIISIGTITT